VASRTLFDARRLQVVYTGLFCVFKFDAYMGHLRKASRALFHARRLQVVYIGLFCVLGLILCVYRALLRGFKSLFGVGSFCVYVGWLNVYAGPKRRYLTLSGFR